MHPDLWTLVVAAISVSIFFTLHCADCRKMGDGDVLKNLMRICVATIVLPSIITGILSIAGITTATLAVMVMIALTATMIHGLFCFVYILCIFGPYETSVRMRLIREVGNKGNAGITFQELLSLYNEKTITDIRLKRLTGSDYIRQEGNVYVKGNATNVFFLFDIIVNTLTAMIGKK